MEAIASILPRVLAALQDCVVAAAPPPQLPRDAQPHLPAGPAFTQRTRLASHRWNNCFYDADCGAGPDICIDHQCVPRCYDTDATTFATTMDAVVAQATTPGRTTAYLPHPGPGKKLLWQKITQSDGCKTPTLLLEYSCITPSGALAAEPHLAFHYVACPPQTVCGSATDTVTGVTAAACVPVPLPPDTGPACDTNVGPAWIGLGISTNASPIYALHVHGGTLYAGGTTGIRSWDANTIAWQEMNAGLPAPAWGNSPLMTDLATAGGQLFAVMHNATENRFWRWNTLATSWEPASAAPLLARTLLPHDDTLFIGTDDGIAWYDPALYTYTTFGPLSGAGVQSLFRTGSQLLFGTGAGTVGGFELDADTATTFAAFAPTGVVTALGIYGEYLYIGAQSGLTRCWTEDGLWGGVATYCEPIEPETGFPLDESVQAVTIYNDALYLASSLGVFRFQADNDTWHAENAGFPVGPGGDLTTHAFTVYQGSLLVGTQQGVYQRCP